MKHLLKLLDCSTEEIIGLLDLADQPSMRKSTTFPIVIWKVRALA